MYIPVSSEAIIVSIGFELIVTCMYVHVQYALKSRCMYNVTYIVYQVYTPGHLALHE